MPILADADETVIGGDLRLKGAIKEGMAELTKPYSRSDPQMRSTTASFLRGFLM
ncbi:MAG: hypothetical protein ABSG65_35345 [Bryobacteraceae bacterium]